MWFRGGEAEERPSVSYYPAGNSGALCPCFRRGVPEGGGGGEGRIKTHELNHVLYLALHILRTTGRNTRTSAVLGLRSVGLSWLVQQQQKKRAVERREEIDPRLRVSGFQNRLEKGPSYSCMRTRFSRHARPRSRSDSMAHTTMSTYTRILWNKD